MEQVTLDELESRWNDYCVLCKENQVEPAFKGFLIWLDENGS